MELLGALILFMSVGYLAPLFFSNPPSYVMRCVTGIGVGLSLIVAAGLAGRKRGRDMLFVAWFWGAALPSALLLFQVAYVILSQRHFYLGGRTFVMVVLAAMLAAPLVNSRLRYRSDRGLGSR